jgi:hypothetical protein
LYFWAKQEQVSVLTIDTKRVSHSLGRLPFQKAEMLKC